MEKRYQIFVSSTFDDLKDHRRLVMEQILTMGHIPIGMEQFNAGDLDQWSYIEKQIEISDYYVVIVAERYGSIDPVSCISYTEKEYRLAVTKKIPVAALLLSDEGRKKLERQYVEDERKVEIDAFRALCKQKMIKHWAQPLELPLQAGNAINAMIKETPRPGLVSSRLLPPENVLAEMARLSADNKRLSEELDHLKSLSMTSKLNSSEQELINQLKSVTLSDFLKAHKISYDWYAEPAKHSYTLTGGIEELRANQVKITAPEISFWDILIGISAHQGTSVDDYSLDQVIQVIAHPLGSGGLEY
jgi:hypothetical protein